jgi:hypothetical protein
MSVTLHTTHGELKVRKVHCGSTIADLFAQIEVFCEAVPKAAEVPELTDLRRLGILCALRSDCGSAL